MLDGARHRIFVHRLGAHEEILANASGSGGEAQPYKEYGEQRGSECGVDRKFIHKRSAHDRHFLSALGRNTHAKNPPVTAGLLSPPVCSARQAPTNRPLLRAAWA
ncbi:hypothetical protein, partial [Zoogloea sp.]|uniref:hypothetical protein n=1 Tax=Zoogloea sp. TaxID=49181 RepID=UPI002C6299A6